MYFVTASRTYGWAAWKITVNIQNFQNAPNVSCWRSAGAARQSQKERMGIFMRMIRSVGKLRATLPRRQTQMRTLACSHLWLAAGQCCDSNTSEMERSGIELEASRV
jgi:hypothetical protein